MEAPSTSPFLNVHGGKFEVKENSFFSHCVRHFERKIKNQLSMSAITLWRLHSECEKENIILYFAMETDRY